MNRGKNTLIVSFLAVPLALYVLFVLAPYASALIFAFTRWSGLSANITFNGFNNFIKLYSDEKFWNALSHNAIALIVLPPIIAAIALFFAFIFTQGIKFARGFRIAYFFPQVLSVVIVAVLWGFIYGLILYVAMNYVVAPLSAAATGQFAGLSEIAPRLRDSFSDVRPRWDPHYPWMIPGTLFTHTVLVGIPIAWAAQRR